MKMDNDSTTPHLCEYRYKRFDKMELQIEKVEGNQGKQVWALIGILFTTVVATSIRFVLTALP